MKYALWCTTDTAQYSINRACSITVVGAEYFTLLMVFQFITGTEQSHGQKQVSGLKLDGLD